MKYECGIIADLLPLYVDGICSEESKKIVEEHLEECEECKKLVEQMKKSIEIPADKGADIKGFKKFVNKTIIKRTVIVAVVLIVLLFIGNYYVTTRFTEIWPKCDAEGLQEMLEVVEIDGELYLHQNEIFGFGEIVIYDVNYDNGVVKLYLAEQGINTLAPFGKYKLMPMHEKYQVISDDEELDIQKVIYCHKNGTEVTTLWEKGQTLKSLSVNP